MWILLACAAPPPAGEAVYVWQGWRPEVATAATASGLRLFVLHAEVGDTVRRLDAPHRAHAAVVRIDTLDHLDPALLEAVAREPGVDEVQLDVDVPTAQLDRYATVLDDLDLPVPLTITGLPAWLRSPALPAVLDAVDGWTLQLHAPTDPVLADVDLADIPRERPFRVALPTYGVGLVEDAEGVVTGVVGEGQRFGGREAWAEPAAVAEVVRNLPEDPSFLGPIWFRLPVEGDRWTWSRATWDTVRAGRAPQAALRVVQDGADLSVENRGDGDASAEAFTLTGEITAFDAVSGWRATRTATGVRFDPPARRVPAHATLPAGWARGTFSVAP